MEARGGGEVFVTLVLGVQLHVLYNLCTLQSNNRLRTSNEPHKKYEYDIKRTSLRFFLSTGIRGRELE